jgi:diguanylate cyclase (GGDEF)-like protein
MQEIRASSVPSEVPRVEVLPELSQEIVQRRWKDVNVLLRLSMLGGLPMEFDATLNLLCDFAGEMVPHEKALAYFWDEEQEQFTARMFRGMKCIPDSLLESNILNTWIGGCNRPLLLRRGEHPQADVLLNSLQAASALAVPLMVSNRTLGSLQLFSSNPSQFNREDAQLLWMLSLIAEGLLTREYAHQGLITFAFTDYLTGLKTRGYFEQQLDLEIRRADRKQTEFALLMVDIDFFKPLNDRYGHHVGDQVLRDVAALLMKDMRDIDTVARYGGEEFVMILPETTLSEAVRVAQRLRRAVERARFFAGSAGAVERLTISIGIANFDTGIQSKRELIERADKALYEAKARGRNQIVVYSELAEQDKTKPQAP